MMWQSLHQGQPKQYSISKRDGLKAPLPQDLPTSSASPSIEISNNEKTTFHHEVSTKKHKSSKNPTNDSRGLYLNSKVTSTSNLTVNAEKLVTAKRYEDALDLVKTDGNCQNDLLDWIYRAMFADWGARLRSRYMKGMDNELEEGMFALLLSESNDSAESSSIDDSNIVQRTEVDSNDENDANKNNPEEKSHDGNMQKLDLKSSTSIEESENKKYSSFIIQPLNLPPPPPPPRLPSNSRQRCEKELDYIARETMSLSLFLEMVHKGPASKLSVAQKNKCWKLYEELCQYYNSSPKSIIFYAKFLAFPGNMDRDDNEFIPCLIESLGKKAAKLGDIYALKIILPFVEETNNDPNTRTSVLNTQLDILSQISLEMEPSQFLHLIPTELPDDQLLSIKNWLMTRIENCFKDTSVPLVIPLALSQFGAEEFGFTEMQQLQEKWRESLSLSLPCMIQEDSKNLISEEKLSRDTRSQDESESHDNIPQCGNDVLKQNSLCDQVLMNAALEEAEKRFEQTIEALEHALRYQIEERMKIQMQLKQVQEEKQSHGSNAQKMAGEIKLLIHDIMGKHNKQDDDIDINSATAQNELIDLDELLSGFLMESSHQNETSMDRKDVAWFINEIKWRLNRVQKVNRKEQSIVAEFMERLVKLLEVHLRQSDTTTSTTGTLIVANSTCSLPELETKVKRQVLYEKEVEISKLHGTIIQLEEQLQALKVTENNKTEDKNKVHPNSSELERKYHALENRHRTLASQMQESLSKKMEELSSVRKINLALEDQLNEIQISSSKKLSYMQEERDKAISSLEHQIQRQNEQINNLRNDLHRSEHLREQVDMLSQKRDADRVRLRYLENMIKELEMALARAKGTRNCAYDSISCFDVGNTIPNSQDSSTHDHSHQNGNGNDDPSLKKILGLESELAEMARILELSERKRARMQENFDRERSLYANRFQQVQDMMVKLLQEQEQKTPTR